MSDIGLEDCLVESNWRPDEAVLVLDAHLDLEDGADADGRLASLAAELKRSVTAIGAAVDAVRRAAGGQGPRASRLLRALAHLLDTPAEVRRLAKIIRAHMRS